MKKLLIQLWHYMPMLLILLISSITYIYVNNYFMNDKKIHISKIKHEPLYIMKNATFNDESLIKQQINYKIQATQALQFEDDKTFNLQGVQIIAYQKPQTTTINADNAQIDANFDSINLNTVNIQAVNNLNTSKITHIKSQHMIFYPRLDQITSNQRTYITQQQNNILSYINADNIIFDNITHNFNLKGNIDGKFNK